MSAMIFVESLPMWSLSLFGQQSPAAPYWRSCAAEEMKSAITDISYVAFQTLNLKPIHWKAIVSRLNLKITVLCTMASYAAANCHFGQDAHRRMASELRDLGAPKSAREASELKITSLSMVRNFSCH
jgi:hypothetical protein